MFPEKWRASFKIVLERLSVNVAYTVEHAKLKKSKIPKLTYRTQVKVKCFRKKKMNSNTFLFSTKGDKV